MPVDRVLSPASIARAAVHAGRTALVDQAGPATYEELLAGSARIAGALLAGRADLAEARIAFRVAPGREHVMALWGIWRAGGIAVPLALPHPAPEVARTVADAGAELVLADDPRAAPLAALPDATRVLPTATALAGPVGPLPTVSDERRALMIYTSGTTGQPKGVVTTHAQLRAQVESLVTAWEWVSGDRILLVLPLHHVHGLVNVVACALWSGATCEMPPRFDPVHAWQRLASGALTLFMAVPTVYRRLIAAWEQADAATRETWSAGARRLRLMVSGSAPLPVPVLERWRTITGHTLLERYGMTEIGMALGNPLHGERRPGYVGTPFPGVTVRIVDEAGDPVGPGTPGELEVRGATVFREYWDRPEETAAAFRDGWFHTGDVAVEEDGAYRLLGRSSTDIIKTGGYKVSALEIEDVLRTHPAIAECAVVARPDDTWGECVCVAVELTAGAALTLEGLRTWARDRMAPYKIPHALVCVDALPRNAMGKVIKGEVRRLLEGSGIGDRGSGLQS